MADVLAQPAGKRTQQVRLEFIGAPIADGDGGFTNRPRGLCPSDWFVSIEPATERSLERVTAGTVTSNATHILTGPYHPGITTNTRAIWKDRSLKDHTAEIVGVFDPEGRGVKTVAVCTEIVP